MGTFYSKIMISRKLEYNRSMGFTMVEVMVGLLIITIAFASLSTVFTGISKSILVNKTKTLAVNLAQEKIESLKDRTYYRLLVSTEVVSGDITKYPNATNMYHDDGSVNSFYPEETLFVGGQTFYRNVLVEYLKTSGDELIGYPFTTWANSDTGIKRVTVYVTWEESGDWKKVELRNMRNNPNRSQLDYLFSGTVTSATTGIPIYNAYVDTLQDPSFSAHTDPNGIYSFKVSPGTYTLRATATGFFQSLSTTTLILAGDTGSSTLDLQMTLKAKGATTGYAYIRDHLVITQVVADYDDPNYPGIKDNQEWVELYNPTTYSILIATKSSAAQPNYDIFFTSVAWIDNSNGDPGVGGSRYLIAMPGTPQSSFTKFRSTTSVWSTGFATHSVYVPSHKYFLISNFSTVSINGVGSRRADAVYGDGEGSADLIDPTGGIYVIGAQGYSYNGRDDWHDGVAWGSVAASHQAAEGISNTISLYASNSLSRIFKKTSASDCLEDTSRDLRNGVFPDFPNGLANVFDSNNNGTNCTGGADLDWDVVTYHILNMVGIGNVDLEMDPFTGTPAVGASVSMNDGESAGAFVQAYGDYNVQGVSTGAWYVNITSGNYTTTISSAVVLPGETTGVPNGLTIPDSYGGVDTLVALSSISLFGYISGTVTDIFLNGLEGVSMSANYVESVVLTDSLGQYRLLIDPVEPTVTVTADKDTFSNGVQAGVAVAAGNNTSGIDFVMVSAGGIRGFVTTNGTPSGALPGVPVVAYYQSSTTVVGNSITGSDGHFLIPSVDTGVYVVEPQLDTSEVSSPGSVTVNVQNISTGTWSSTFTVTNAYGAITGAVTVGTPSEEITTGVLVVASSETIGTVNPPEIDSDVRSGSVIYYSVSSDSSGRYSLSLRGGNTYYLYGWYTSELDVSVSSTVKVQGAGSGCTGCIWVEPGATVSRDLSWP